MSNGIKDDDYCEYCNNSYNEPAISEPFKMDAHNKDPTHLLSAATEFSTAIIRDRRRTAAGGGPGKCRPELGRNGELHDNDMMSSFLIVGRGRREEMRCEWQAKRNCVCEMRCRTVFFLVLLFYSIERGAPFPCAEAKRRRKERGRGRVTKNGESRFPFQRLLCSVFTTNVDLKRTPTWHLSKQSIPTGKMLGFNVSPFLAVLSNLGLSGRTSRSKGKGWQL